MIVSQEVVKLVSALEVGGLLTEKPTAAGAKAGGYDAGNQAKFVARQKALLELNRIIRDLIFNEDSFVSQLLRLTNRPYDIDLYATLLAANAEASMRLEDLNASVSEAYNEILETDYSRYGPKVGAGGSFAISDSFSRGADGFSVVKESDKLSDNLLIFNHNEKLIMHLLKSNYKTLRLANEDSFIEVGFKDIISKNNLLLLKFVKERTKMMVKLITIKNGYHSMRTYEEEERRAEELHEAAVNQSIAAEKEEKRGGPEHSDVEAEMSEDSFLAVDSLDGAALEAKISFADIAAVEESLFFTVSPIKAETNSLTKDDSLRLVEEENINLRRQLDEARTREAAKDLRIKGMEDTIKRAEDEIQELHGRIIKIADSNSRLKSKLVIERAGGATTPSAAGVTTKEGMRLDEVGHDLRVKKPEHLLSLNP